MTVSNKRKILALVIGLPILFALAIREFYGIHSMAMLYTVMSISFIFFLPFAVGALTIYLHPFKKYKSAFIACSCPGFLY